ncbi:MAG: branched-chain amino acid transaminase [Nitrososphaeraceae archaeon]|nr:branched-chain amino acid transaminase [Nitrososphaeraceae archaeon]MDW0153385.1 branched-chain amino acid transaminase [Nitrososphaeraceae archaeon]MDW0166090.1 branched-chain amino acid transaminase [Nitrososphaeraceae archaeon]
MKDKGVDFIWFDGQYLKWEEAKVPIFVHALHYGTAVFEGIRAYPSDDNLYIFRLKEHMDRLRKSANVYSFTTKFSADELCKAAVDLIRKNGIRESCYLRPLTFVGMHGIDLNVTKNSPTHTTIIIFPFSKYFKGDGISACISSWRRIDDESIPPMAKASGNYLNSVLATQECRRNGYDESILLDRNGCVSEASGENIFVVRNGKLHTPQLSDSILEGITRNTAITIAGELGYDVVERPISRTELYLADEIFLTGTAAEIIAITKIDGNIIGNGREGTMTKGIRENYERIVIGKSEKFMGWLTPTW